MKQAAAAMPPQCRPLAVVVSLLFAGMMGAANAADVQINAVDTITVVAGDRIGIRIRTNALTDASAADITQLSFSATLTYTRAPPGP